MDQRRMDAKTKKLLDMACQLWKNDPAFKGVDKWMRDVIEGTQSSDKHSKFIGYWVNKYIEHTMR